MREIHLIVVLLFFFWQSGRWLPEKYRKTGPQTDKHCEVSGAELICFLSRKLCLQCKVTNSFLGCTSITLPSNVDNIVVFVLLHLVAVVDCIMYCIYLRSDQYISLMKHSMLPLVSYKESCPLDPCACFFNDAKVCQETKSSSFV